MKPVDVETETETETEKKPENDPNDLTGEYVEDSPYYITVNRTQNIVIIYTKDDKGQYTVPMKAMVCSVGLGERTPVGEFTTSVKWRWAMLNGDVYGQYATQITGNILFHSVPYTRKYDNSSLEYWEYDKLGTNASLGCIRLTVANAKWIYDNCQTGTLVTFYSDSNPGPLGKPSEKKISGVELCRDWDPTDPAGENPWRNYSKDDKKQEQKPEEKPKQNIENVEENREIENKENENVLQNKETENILQNKENENTHENQEAENTQNNKEIGNTQKNAEAENQNRDVSENKESTKKIRVN